MANYDSPTSVYDAVDNITPIADGNNRCTEIWKLTDTMIACVEMGGSVTRLFDTSSNDDGLGADTVDDFILDYVEY